MLRDSFGITGTKDISSFEGEGKYLEGTGSLVLDRKNRIAYSNISSRSNPELLTYWCKEMKYDLVPFTASTRGNKEIYHTNVMMAIGEKTSLACPDVIQDPHERMVVMQKLSQHRRLVEISEEQLMHFAGNMLLIKNREGMNFWVMSDRAFQSLTPAQVEALKSDGDFICSNLKTIEEVGGGSARCMIAEVF